ncbi:hypothetical protein NDU88_003912 [Pleurodeles waltl]|uniref:Uncharacterized protein n=1 Tax=Pleurodeles waltl TaxID=8319 RepID=A0AAV7SHB3_PLEWA|nr:hypothetical protein NDU88_003912 [Pleurodeles waltl]
MRANRAEVRDTKELVAVPSRPVLCGVAETGTAWNIPRGVAERQELSFWPGRAEKPNRTCEHRSGLGRLP